MAKEAVLRLVDEVEQRGQWSKNAIEHELSRPTRELAGAVLVIPAARLIVHGNSRIEAVGALAHAQYVLSRLEEGD